MAATSEKYRQIARQGFEACLNSQYPEYTGPAEMLKQRFTVAALLDPKDIEERILKQITTAGNLNGFELAIAGRDFQLHTTILEADPGKGNLENMENLTGIMDRPERIRITFDDLLVDRAGVTILVARQIPDEILEAREKLEKIYSEAGLKPRSLDNILHTTLARIRKPAPDMISQLAQYRLPGLRTEVRRQPVEGRILRIYTGNVWDLLSTNSIGRDRTGENA